MKPLTKAVCARDKIALERELARAQIKQAQASLVEASRLGYRDIAEIILKKEDVLFSHHNFKAMAVAAGEGHKDLVSFYWDLLPPFDKAQHMHQAAFLQASAMAVQKNKRDILEYLFEKPLPPQTMKLNGLLNGAVMCGAGECLTFLLSKNTQPLDKNLLSVCASEGHVKLMKDLFPFFKTMPPYVEALNHAVSSGKLNTVACLLDEKDYGGHVNFSLLLERAVAAKNKEIVALLFPYADRKRLTDFLDRSHVFARMNEGSENFLYLQHLLQSAESRENLLENISSSQPSTRKLKM